MTESKSLLEQAIDVCICAPVGLAITVTEELPQLIDKGRERVTSQVSLAKMVGSFAVAYGQREAERVVRQATGRPQPPARRAGPSARPTPEAGPGGRPNEGPLARSTEAGPGGRPNEGPLARKGEPGGVEATTAASLDGRAATSHANTHADGASSASRVAGAAPAGNAGALAIHGYDALSASQVVQRLAGLSPEELEEVRAYEAATRGRRTILNRVSQLQAHSGS